MSDESWRDTYDHWKTASPDDELDGIECPECGGAGVLEDQCECESVVDICCCAVPTPPRCPECRVRGFVR